MDSILVHCARCNQDKTETDFYRFKTGKLKHPCKECTKAENKARYIPKGPPPVPQGYRRCTRCLQVLPMTAEYFFSNKSKPGGVSTLCRTCHREYEKARHECPKLVIETKTCRVCKEEKPATTDFFERNNSRIYGLNTICKECGAAARRRPSPYEPVPMGYKRCKQCLEVKPATSDFFRVDKQVKDGMRNQCRECRKLYRRKPLPHKPRKRKPVPVGDRQCNVCKQFFPRTREHFFYARHAVDRLQSSCKKCFGKQCAERESARPVEERHRKRREYYQAHKEAIVARIRRYHQSPKGRLTLRTATLNRIARKKSVQGSYTSAQIAEQLKRQKYHCYYAACGHAKFTRIKENGEWKYTYHVEHTFPISRVVNTDIPANDIGYLVLACPSCNRSKGNKFPWEWPDGGRLL